MVNLVDVHDHANSSGDIPSSFATKGTETSPLSGIRGGRDMLSINAYNGLAQFSSYFAISWCWTWRQSYSAIPAMD